MLKVEVVDANFVNLGELSDIGNLTTVSRSTRGGTFTLSAPTTPPALLLRDTAGAGIRVTDTTGSFVGIVTNYEILVDDRGERITFTGVDHLARLGWRWTGPEPLTAAPPFSTDAYATYIGTVTNVIASMVDDRCGTAALAAREFLTVNTPTSAGPTITVQLRFRSTLEETVHALCVAYGMSCAVTLGSGGLEFDVWESVTRSDAPVGPEIGGVQSYRAGAAAPEATDVIAGGQGELTARTFVQTSKAPSSRWPWRIETYIEHTEIDNTGDLSDAAVEHLEETAESVHFTADVTAYETDAIRFGRDFFLGDRIPLRLGGSETFAPVTEVEMTVAETVSRNLTVGFPPAEGVQLAIIESKRADQLARRQRGQ